jgi:hypothetical protein
MTSLNKQNIQNPMEKYFRTIKEGKDQLTTCHEGTEGK